MSSLVSEGTAGPTPIIKLGTPSVSVSEDGSVERGRVGIDTSTRSFTILKFLGDGAFSTITLCDWHSPDLFANVPLSDMELEPTRRLAINGLSYERLVAVKKIRRVWSATEAEIALSLCAVKVPSVLPAHPNIVQQYDAFLDVSTDSNCYIYVVMEPMEGNLYHLMRARRGKPFAAGLMMSMLYQLASAINHVHSNGYMHRDVKPENILVTTTGIQDYTTAWPQSSQPNSGIRRDIVAILKLADFGLAKPCGSTGPYTEYVATRWYRAPEVLLLANQYTLAVDNWALGAILAELANLAPIFPGTSHIDQLNCIVQKLGSPVPGEAAFDDYGQPVNGGSWPEGVALARQLGFRFPSVTPTRFSSFFEPEVSPLFVHCVGGLLSWNPDQRFTSRMCLDSEFLEDFTNFR